MTTYVALLHSIVLLNGRLVMADLKALAEKLGLGTPRTLAATGNLVFTADAPAAKLEAKLEKAFAERFGKPVDIIVRTAAEWRELVDGNPYGDGESVMVRVMRKSLPHKVIDDLERYRPPKDQLCIVGGDLWVKFAGKPSQSRLLSALTTQKLGVGTSRIWNTVRKLGEMVSDA